MAMRVSREPSSGRGSKGECSINFARYDIRHTAYPKVNPIGRTTSGPIHGQVDEPEGPFKLVEEHFSPGPNFPEIRFPGRTLDRTMALSKPKRPFWLVGLGMDRRGVFLIGLTSRYADIGDGDASEPGISK